MAIAVATSYDALVIGAGQGGKPLALALAAAGRKTALVERAFIGGTCVNYGCTPTKTMVASARAAYLARRAAEYGVHVGPVRVAMDEVRRRKQAVVESFRARGERRIAETKNLTLVHGEARFIGPRRVAVTLDDKTEVEIAAELVFLDTGSRPAVPELPGLDGVPHHDSTSIMELDELPEHLLVLGGGYVGLEFGQMFRRFGSRVTVVQQGPKLLAREDPDVADAVATLLREDGIDVLVDTSAVRVEAESGGAVRLTVRTGGGGERSLDGSHLLIAVGRVPNTEALSLAAAGVEVDKRGYVRVDTQLRTTAPGVYSIGDINAGPAFTHIAYDDFRILRTNLLEGGHATTEGRMVPYTVFIDPQLGRIGRTESEARRSGRAVRVAKLPMTSVARAIEVSETRGFLKAIVDAGNEEIMGAAMLGIEGGELMSMLEIAMMGHLRYPVLREAIFSHPTLAECFNNLFASFEDGRP